MSIQLNQELLLSVAQHNLTRTAELLELGADPNVETADQIYSPLIIAAALNNTKITELLVKHGAKPEQTNKLGQTAASIALINKTYPLLPILYEKGSPQLRGQIVHALNQRDNMGWSPLLHEVSDNHLYNIRAICSIPGVDLNKTTSTGISPLILAVNKGHKEAVSLLANSPNVDINQGDAQQNTPLIFATFQEATDIVKILVQVPTLDFNKTNLNGTTALEIAKRKGFIDIIKALSIDQNVILDKIQKYLYLQLKRQREKKENELIGDYSKEKKGKGEVRHYNEDEINSFLPEIMLGLCNGFSGLWMYRKRRDEENQFFSILRLIATWDEKSESLVEGDGFLNQTFEQLINDLRWIQDQAFMMQYRVLQRDLEKSIGFLKPTKEVPLKEEFHFNFIVLSEELTELLENVVHEGKQINIRGPDHVMSVMLKGGIYYAYDPNDPAGERSFKSLEDLQEYIELKLYTDMGWYSEKMPIALTVYDLATEKPYPYPKSPVELLQGFIEKNNDVNREFKGYNSLLWAGEFGDNDIVKALLKNPDIHVNNKESSSSFSPIMGAAMFGSTEIVESLIQDSRINKDHFYEAMMVAAKNNNLECARLLGHAININFQDPMVKLNIAAVRGDLRTIQNILENQNLNLNHQDDMGRTLLHWAALGGHSKIVNLLLGSEVIDPNLADVRGNTAVKLSLDAMYNKVSTAKEFLKRTNINYELRDDNAFTPLISAINQNNPGLVKVFLDSGKMGPKVLWPAYFFARVTGKTDFAEMIAEVQKINTKDSFVEIICAAGLGEDRALQELQYKNPTKFSALINQQDPSGLSPLIWTTRIGNISTAKYLLTAGANPNLQDYEGLTSLMWAVKVGNVELVKILSEDPRSDFTLKDNQGRTALDIANTNVSVFQPIITILEDKMAKQPMGSSLNLPLYKAKLHKSRSAEVDPDVKSTENRPPTNSSV